MAVFILVIRPFHIDYLRLMKDSTIRAIFPI